MELEEDESHKGQILRSPRRATLKSNGEDSDRIVSNLEMSSRWFGSKTDTALYAIALDACNTTSGRLKARLSEEDRRVFEHAQSRDALEEFIRDTERKIKRKDEARSKSSQNISKLANGFCDFASRMTALAVALKSEKQKEALDYFGHFQEVLPDMYAYDGLFPTKEMKLLLAAICADMVNLLEHAAAYYALGRLSKLADAMFPRSKYEFSKDFGKLSLLTKRLRDLAEICHFAEQQQVKETVEDTGAVIADLYRMMNSAVGNMGGLNHEVEELRAISNKWNRLEASRASSTLQDVLLPDLEDIAEELRMWQKVKFRLSPKDRWESNGILMHLNFWTKLPQNSILWISGPCLQRDPWVSEFSLDVIRASQAQDTLLTFALCDRPGEEMYSDAQVVKRLICRIMELRPMLVLELPDIFDRRLFQRARSFEQCFQIFERIVAKLDSAFVVIDRLDLCRLEDSADDDVGLLGGLSHLVAKHPQSLRVIITTIESNPPPPNQSISFSKIETYTRPYRRVDGPTRRHRSRSSLDSYSSRTSSGYIPRSPRQSLTAVTRSSIEPASYVTRSVTEPSVVYERRPRGRINSEDSTGSSF